MTSKSQSFSLDGRAQLANSNIQGDTMKSISEDNSKNEATAEELLYYLQHRSTEDYRYVRYPLKCNDSKFLKRVSFDTINLQYDQDSDDSDYDDGFNDYQLSSYDRSRGRNRARSPSPHHKSPLNSPSPSGIFRTSYDNNDFNLFLNNKRGKMPSKPTYPTTPIITHKGCTFTRVHPDFEDLYLGKVKNKSIGGNKKLKAVVPGRVILIYISGRKHTWVALDWILNNFIEHGDRVVVVSSMSTSMAPRRRSFSYFAPSKALSPEARLKHRCKPEYAVQIAKNIMKYILQVIDLEKITKVTVELAVGDSKSVLKDMYRLYQPNLVCTGTKPNQSVSAPLKSWSSSRVVDRLVKNFPLPVIAVPAMNMNEFELDLQSKMKDHKTGIKSTPNAFLTRLESDSFIPILKSDNDDTADSQSISSSSSVGSLSSEDSYSSFLEITELFVNHKKKLKKDMKSLSELPINENYFSNFAKVISDTSTELCQELRSIDPDFRGNGAKLARAITGSNSFGVVPYKTKSLLGPVEKKVSPPMNAISYKDLKKSLKLKSTSNIPKIEVNSSSPPSSPRKQSLKFAELEKPPSKIKAKSKSLKKSLSHDIDNSSSRPELVPTKSQPDIRVIHPSSELDEFKPDITKKKKKKKKFWNLFK